MISRYFFSIAMALSVSASAFAATPPAVWSPQVGVATLYDSSGNPISSSNPLAVNATVSASIAGFRPVTTGIPITATTSGVTGTLPVGAEVVVSNTDTTNIVYCNLGASASTSNQPIGPNGGWFGFGISGDTQLTCITSTGTAKVVLQGGLGLPTGIGGAGGSGSSGTVFGPTADGSSAANPPILVGGTNDGTGTGTVGVAKVSTSGLVSVDGSAVTQPISATALPLPTGAATATGLSTINTTLGSPMQNSGGSVTVDGSNGGALQTTTNNSLEPPTEASGKITAASVAVTASTSTTVVALNTGRIAIAIQCNVACKVSETGATLTSASQISTEGGVVIAAGGYFIPPLASRTAYTVYMGSNGVVSYTDYSR